MKYLILIIALCIPNFSVAASYLCLPEVTVGWTNNDNPNDIRIIEPKHKWLLQPIEPKKIAMAYVDDEQEVNYSLTKLGQTKEYGFCWLDDTYGYCYEFKWPGETPSPLSDNKLSDYNQYLFDTTRDGTKAYVFSDVGNQGYYAINGVDKYFEPRVAIERGRCDAF
jgi:hypothetical protein